MKRYIVGITGASGSIYGIRLTKELLSAGCEVYLVVSELGRDVIEYEMQKSFDSIINDIKSDKLKLMDNKNMFSPIASGSFPTDGMVIIPASMSTVAKIRHGNNDNLLTRAADVVIKEKRNLIIVPRETPLSTIHLENLYELSKIGVHIIPPMPAFYSLPNSLDDIINQTTGRIMSILGIDNTLYTKWGE